MVSIQYEIQVAITFRIWRSSLSRRFAHFIIRVITESGLLYTLTTIPALCLAFPYPSNGFGIATAIVCHQ